LENWLRELVGEDRIALSRTQRRLLEQLATGPWHQIAVQPGAYAETYNYVRIRGSVDVVLGWDMGAWDAADTAGYTGVNAIDVREGVNGSLRSVGGKLVPAGWIVVWDEGSPGVGAHSLAHVAGLAYRRISIVETTWQFSAQTEQPPRFFTANDGVVFGEEMLVLAGYSSVEGVDLITSPWRRAEVLAETAERRRTLVQLV
jgi:hypothetical protein